MKWLPQTARRSSLLLVSCFLLPGPVLADVAPPPPEIPGTRLELPSALQVITAGAALSIAVFAAVRLVTKKNTSSGMRTWGVVLIAIISFVSIVAAVYTEMQYAAYAEEVRRDRNRPRGPAPEPFRPEDEISIPQPAGQDGSVAAEGDGSPKE